MISDHVTVLRHGTNEYTVCFEQTGSRSPVQAVHRLTFDEMLGLVVKLLIPFTDNGPIFSPRQLFLGAPNADATKAAEQERVDNRSPS